MHSISQLKYFLISVAFFLNTSLFLQKAFADERPIEKCSVELANTCATIQFKMTPKVNEEGKFLLKIKAPDLAQVKNLKVELWMDMGGHGHGSAPVTLQKISDQVYNVTNAWFVMEGTWTIRVSFDPSAKSVTLNFPVEVSE